MMTNRVRSWPLLIATLAMVACAHTAHIKRAANVDQLQGRSYAVASIAEHGVRYQSLEGNPAISFGTGGEFQMESGCNAIAGTYVARVDQLAMSGGTTLVRCEGTRGLQDRLLLNLANTTSTFRLRGRTLTLSTNDVEVTAVRTTR